MSLIRNGALDCTFVVSDKQTCGRGRHGRFWLSTENSLAISCIKRSNIRIEHATRFTLLSAMAIVEALKLFHIVTQIKWPNDILLSDGRKVCGILVETQISQNLLEAAVIGVGINVTRSPDEDQSIGFLSDAGFVGDKEIILEAIVASLESRLNDPSDDELFAQCLMHHKQHSNVKTIDLDVNGALVTGGGGVT